MSADASAKTPSRDDRWQAFVAVPTRCIALRWLCDCLGDVADEATQQSLACHPRFRQRLAQRLIQQHGLTSPDALPIPGEDDLPLFLLSPNAGDILVKYSGMICHAMAFVREIRAPRVIELKQRFGESSFVTALANRDLAIHQGPYTDDDALEYAVLRDGVACLAIWLAQQPAELAAWLRLGLASDPRLADADISPEVREHGVAIIRRAAAVILDDPAEEPV
ncbi:hypothetical protein [Litchfieldella rifensis]|uniref:Type III secretion protein n=1 Tax=Litchfieldella rifensis TaxID=762643 RepID=A0ABV7LIB3_9GAMM